MERAVYLDRPLEQLTEGYDRLYFGAEFCPWAFPEPAEIEQAIACARRRGYAFTLVTPLLAEPFLSRLRATLLRIVPQLVAGDELLISDIGALVLVQELGLSLPVVFGRTLSGQKRGPQILDLQLGANEVAYFQKGNWYAAEAVNFLAEQRVGRLELDNLLQGVAPLPTGMRGSLHYPYAMVTSSRNCPFRPAGEDCGTDCGEVFVLTAKTSPLPLLQRGNTQFLRHDRLPADLTVLGIDRLVFSPALPR